MEIWFRLIYLLSAFGVSVSELNIFSIKYTVKYKSFLVLLRKLIEEISSSRLVVRTKMDYCFIATFDII